MLAPMRNMAPSQSPCFDVARTHPRLSRYPASSYGSAVYVRPSRAADALPLGWSVGGDRRSYLDPGTEVPIGYPSREDYAFPPGGDPGQPYWYYGPDQHGVGGRPLAPWFRLPGLNPPNGPTE
jgi:hypothetical protein